MYSIAIANLLKSCTEVADSSTLLLQVAVYVELLLLTESNTCVANSCVVLMLLTDVLVLLLLLTAVYSSIAVAQLYRIAVSDTCIVLLLLTVVLVFLLLLTALL